MTSNSNAKLSFHTYEIFDPRSLSYNYFYYVPIFPAIKSFFDNEKLVRLLIQEHSRPVNAEIMSTYKDGLLYSAKAHDSQNLEFSIRLFVDDFKPTQRGKTSLFNISGTFNNLQKKYLSKSNSMF